MTEDEPINREDDVPHSEEHKIPKFLYITYLFMFIWGIWALIAYWNGSHGWLDRGYWQQLQRAAHTTFPFEKKEPYLEEKDVLEITNLKEECRDYNDYRSG